MSFIYRNKILSDIQFELYGCQLHCSDVLTVPKVFRKSLSVAGDYGGFIYCSMKIFLYDFRSNFIFIVIH